MIMNEGAIFQKIEFLFISFHSFSFLVFFHVFHFFIYFLFCCIFSFLFFFNEKELCFYTDRFFSFLSRKNAYEKTFAVDNVEEVMSVHHRSSDQFSAACAGWQSSSWRSCNGGRGAERVRR